MASMTACGFCEVLALSRYTKGSSPDTRRSRIGKSFLILSTSKLLMATGSERGGRAKVTVVALGFEALGQFLAAGLSDLAGHEHMDEVGLDVPEDPRVVRD